MRNALLLISIIGSSSVSFAVLPPTVEAPRTAHMVEVNAQWTAQGFARTTGEARIAFASEAERIAMHLHLVREHLMARQPEGSSTGQLQQRADLLNRLDVYADAMTYPQNRVLPVRNPVFIDANGTACAVGWLMIQSGRRDLAERIAHDMNLAYVLDMPGTALWPEIAAWAADHGFTAAELAWIQPGYPPNLPWTPLGGGTNGTVTVIRELANGDLLVAGEFTNAGGIAASHVAVWNGTTYAPLGAGVQGEVNAAVEFNGDLYLGGAMLNGPADLAKWDGTSWSFSSVFDGKYPWISALHVHNGSLYAAGAVSGFAGLNHFVQRMDGSAWTPIGNEFNNTVLALASHGGALIAAGDFTGIITTPVPPQILHIAELNGNQWSQLGDGLDAPVRTLLDVNGTLYAGGDLYANIAVTFGLARIAQGSSSWELLIPNHEGYMVAGVGPTWIGSLTAYNEEIYFGGEFSVYVGMDNGTNIARWGGTADDVAPLAWVEAPVRAVEMTGVQLVMGGEFEAGFPHIAILDLTSSTADRHAVIGTLQLAPNPVTDEVRVVLPPNTTSSTPILFDATGRRVAIAFERKDVGYRALVGALPAGPYVLQVITPDGVMTARFVKQ